MSEITAQVINIACKDLISKVKDHVNKCEIWVTTNTEDIRSNDCTYSIDSSGNINVKCSFSTSQDCCAYGFSIFLYTDINAINIWVPLCIWFKTPMRLRSGKKYNVTIDVTLSYDNEIIVPAPDGTC